MPKDLKFYNGSMLHMSRFKSYEEQAEIAKKNHRMKPGTVVFDFTDEKSIAINDEMFLRNIPRYPKINASASVIELDHLTRKIKKNTKVCRFIKFHNIGNICTGVDCYGNLYVNVYNDNNQWNYVGNISDFTEAPDGTISGSPSAEPKTDELDENIEIIFDKKINDIKLFLFQNNYIKDKNKVYYNEKFYQTGENVDYEADSANTEFTGHIMGDYVKKNREIDYRTNEYLFSHKLSIALRDKRTDVRHKKSLENIFKLVESTNNHFNSLPLSSTELKNYIKVNVFKYLDTNGEYKESDELSHFFASRIVRPVHETVLPNNESEKYCNRCGVYFLYNEDQRTDYSDFLWIVTPDNLDLFYSKFELDGLKNENIWRFHKVIRPLKVYDSVLDRWTNISMKKLLKGATIKDIQMTNDGSAIFILASDGKVYSFGKTSQCDGLKEKLVYENHGILSHQNPNKNFLYQGEYEYKTSIKVDQMVITRQNSFMLNRATGMITVAGKAYTSGMINYLENSEGDINNVKIVGNWDTNDYFIKAVDLPIFYSLKNKQKDDTITRVTNIYPYCPLNSGYPVSIIIEVKTTKAYSDEDTFKYYLLDYNRQNHAGLRDFTLTPAACVTD